MPEHVLIAWLCIWRLQHGTKNNGVMSIPTPVREGWLARGWVEFAHQADPDGYLGCDLTDNGKTVTDLNCAEWGISPMPELTCE